MSKPKPIVQFFLGSILIALLAASPALGDSKARVVRLSEVVGNVEIDRNNGQGYEKAFLNLPVTEGTKVRSNNGRVELQFEDNSTLRIAPQTQIEVTKLSLRDSGAKVTAVHLVEGMAYVNVAGTKGDEFTLNFARQKIALTQPAHFRIALGDADAAVAVFSGEVQVTGPSGAVSVAKNHTAKFDLIDDTYKLAKNVEENPFDGWDKQQSQYEQRYADASYSSYSPYAYGSSDLNYYGNWYNLPGYGQMWQPYFTGAGWDPFMDGSWTAFSGAGYGWVSSYPWGWLPYNYGAWNFVPLYGWMWQPGGAWMGGYPLPVFAGYPLGYTAPRAPMFPGPRVISVSRGSESKVSEGFFSAPRLEIPANSAGLGIPRGGIQNLSQVSGLAAQRGSTTSRLHLDPVMTAWHENGFGNQRLSSWGPRGSSYGARAGFASSGSTSGHSSGSGGHVGGVSGVGGHH